MLRISRQVVFPRFAIETSHSTKKSIIYFITVAQLKATSSGINLGGCSELTSARCGLDISLLDETSNGVVFDDMNHEVSRLIRSFRALGFDV